MKQQKIAALFLLLFAFAFSALAQDIPPPPPPPQKTVVDVDEIVKINSRLVVVPVSVTNADGQPVTNLTEKDFRVLEERKYQRIEKVSPAEKVPLEIAILFDVSASTDAMFQFQQETAAKFLKDVMRPEDRAIVYTVGERPIMIKASNTAEIAGAAIRQIKPTKQYTAFYDTVKAAADYLDANTKPGRRKVIVVISDGEDTNSTGIRKGFNNLYASLGKNLGALTTKMLETKREEIKTREQSKVLQSLQNADTVFYSINPAGSSYRLNKISVFGQSNLQRFADETGGTAFLPKFQPIDLKNDYENQTNMRQNAAILEEIFRKLANELRAQYLVQYYSEADYPQNRFVKLNVTLQNPQNYQVRARQGYFVK